MMLAFPPLSQRDPRWATKSIGYSSEQLGDYGCLYMCLLMMVVHDRNFAPIWVDTFMSCLKGHGNYTRESGAYLQSFDVSACEPADWGTVKLISATGIYNGPFPVDELDRLMAHLHAGQSAILEVDPTPFNPGVGDGSTHYVLAWYVGSDGHIAINDPWDGQIKSLCPQYGPNPAAAIYRAIFYEVS